jgi:hypothetical protein
MNSTEIKAEVITWLKTFVEKPNKLLGGWAPCPYARQARINNKIQIEVSEAVLLEAAIKDNLFLLDEDPIDGTEAEKDVLVVCFDHKEISPNELSEFVEKLNHEQLMVDDYLILEDHPDEPADQVNSLDMHFGKCGLLLVQRLSKLNEASEQLKDKGYYDNWNEDELNYVVNWRKLNNSNGKV